MNLNQFDAHRGQFLRSDAESFARGFSRSVPAIADIFKSALYLKLRERAESKRNLLEEYEDMRDSDQVTGMIDSDPDLTPEEKQRLLTTIPANKNGLRVATKEQRTRLNQTYEDLKRTKSGAAKDEETKKQKQSEIRAEYDAIRIEAEALGPGVMQEMERFMNVSEPTEASNKRFAAALERVYKKRDEKPEKPKELSEGEKKFAVHEKLMKLGGNDLAKGLKIARNDPDYADLVQQADFYGIKPEDKASPKAEKLLEDVQGEWQYEKDRYVEALGKARKDKRVIDGDMTPEQVVAEAGLADPGPINLYAFKYLSDRKDFLNEDAVNEAFHRLNKEAGRDRTGRGMLPMPPEGARPNEIRSTGTGAGSEQVPASQAAALEQKLNRADAILEKLEEEMGLKK